MDLTRRGMPTARSGISPFVRPGTWSTTPYNHYSLLAGVEELFGLPELGYATTPGLNRFGLDVYNASVWPLLLSSGGVSGVASPITLTARAVDADAEGNQPRHPTERDH